MICTFDQEQLGEVLAALTKYVRITGILYSEPGKRAQLEIQNVDVLEHLADPSVVGFWEQVDVETLARRQGVSRFNSSERFEPLWCAHDESVDDFIAMVRSWRDAEVRSK